MTQTNKLSANNEDMECHEAKNQTNTIIEIANALKWYQNLDLKQHDAKDKLIKLYKERYPHILEKYTNIITKSHDNMDDIRRDIASYMTKKCDDANCALSTRHCRDRTLDNVDIDGRFCKTDKLDLEFLFIRDLFDGMHCYLFHPHDMTNYMDKYTIDVVYNISKEKDWMEALYKLFADPTDTKIRDFLHDEEYDSDAIEYDMNGGKAASNIHHSLANKGYYERIKRFIGEWRLSKRSFGTGMIFYYWNYYKNFEKKVEDRWRVSDDEKLTANDDYGNFEDEWNVNDHGGYAIEDLYIEAKYKDLKTEVLENSIHALTLQNFKTTLDKAQRYLDTTIAKGIVADFWGDLQHRLHYGIQPKTPLQVNNLLALLLYTDWDALCTEFGKTFRKCRPDEQLPSIKKRNREFAIWSRLLRETVQLFGYSGRGEWNITTGKKCKVLKGPFFCGMKEEIVIPQFNIRLCGPTSTSKLIDVANRFGGDDGIIIRLDNNGDQRCKELRAFGCHWISKASREEEWLFIGGDQRIKIESIRNLWTKQDFDCNSLFLFDCMVNGTCFNKEPSVSRTDYETLDNLIKHVVNEMHCNYPKYIINTFQCLINNKKQIVINLAELYSSLQQLKNLIISDDLFFKKEVFQLFYKATQFIMYTVGETKLFDLKALLPSIHSAFENSHNIKRIIIKATYNPKETQQSWIFDQRSASTIKQFAEKGLKLDWADTTTHLGDNQDALIISKRPKTPSVDLHNRTWPIVHTPRRIDIDDQEESDDMLISMEVPQNRTVQFNDTINIQTPQSVSDLLPPLFDGISRNISDASVATMVSNETGSTRTMSMETYDAMAGMTDEYSAVSEKLYAMKIEFEKLGLENRRLKEQKLKVTQKYKTKKKLLKQKDVEISQLTNSYFKERANADKREGQLRKQLNEANDNIAILQQIMIVKNIEAQQEINKLKDENKKNALELKKKKIQILTETRINVLDNVESEEKEQKQEMLRDNDEIDMDLWIRHCVWKIGISVEIYSNSLKKWFHGTIKNLEDEGEWVDVQYIVGNTIRSKQITRYSNSIRPYSKEMTNYQHGYAMFPVRNDSKFPLL